MRLIELFLEICKHLLGFTSSFFMLLYRMYNFENHNCIKEIYAIKFIHL